MAGLDSQQLNAIRHLLTDDVLRNALLTGGIAAGQSSQSPAPIDRTPQVSKKRIPQVTSRRSNKQQRRDDVSGDKNSKNKDSNTESAKGGKNDSGRFGSGSSRKKNVAVLSKASIPPTMPKKDRHRSKVGPNLRRTSYKPGAYQESSEIDIFGDEVADSESVRRFVVGLDFGTTFTSVAYYAHSADEKHPMAFPEDVRSITHWSTDQVDGARKQLPTESWYSSQKRTRKSVRGEYDLESLDDTDSDLDATMGATGENQLSEQVSVTIVDSDSPSRYLWGYEVFRERYLENSVRNPDLRIERAKSMLVDSVSTQDDRIILRPQLDGMLRAGLIRRLGKKGPRDVQDVIADFLTEVLKHTGKQLVEREGLTDDCLVSFVIAVPVIWCPDSSRILQYAMEEAIRESGFGKLGYGSIDNLFITTEPEAGATYLIADMKDNYILPGETFIILDCGGGTVDCVTYTVTNSYPLRLATEVGKPDGDNCGGSYLNDNFAKRLLWRLRDEDYLDFNGETRETFVNRLIPDFERFHKRDKDISKSPRGNLSVPGLRRSETKRFLPNLVIFDSQDYNAVFLPILERVSKVLKKQIILALSKGRRPEKVFLIGGFGAAPSLKSYLARFLQQFVQEKNLTFKISLIPPKPPRIILTVACGAVLRALNKDRGPTRQANSSYGFLRIEPYQPQICVGHRDAVPFEDELDGEEYVKVIDYFILMNTTIPAAHTYKAFKSSHTFELDSPRLLCEEVLYVPDDKESESHFSLDHVKNKKAQVAGKILTDMTFLRDQGIIQPILPDEDEEGTVRGKKHYTVEYDLVPIVEGRNLRYEVRYPANQFGKVQNTGQISIAAAFEPGTK